MNSEIPILDFEQKIRKQLTFVDKLFPFIEDFISFCKP